MLRLRLTQLAVLRLLLELQHELAESRAAGSWSRDAHQQEFPSTIVAVSAFADPLYVFTVDREVAMLVPLHSWTGRGLLRLGAM